MNAKPKVQWRPRVAGRVRNVEHLLRKVTGNEQSHLKKEAARAATGSAVEAFGVHILSPQLVPNVVHLLQGLMFVFSVLICFGHIYFYLCFFLLEW